jgi:hypothetical protein
MQNLGTNRRWQSAWTFHRAASVCLLAILVFSACSTIKSGFVSPWSSMTPVEVRLKVESDQRTLKNVARQLENTRSEFIALHRRGGWSNRGYFSSEENNEIKRYYFRFVTGHTTLWDIINSYGGDRTHFADDNT